LARHRGNAIAAVFVSDLTRAVETAEIAFGDAGIPIHQEARLRECNYGLLNGLPVERLAAERSRRIDKPFPRGLSYRQVVDQTREFLRDLVANWEGSQIVIVAHSANRWALDHLLNGIAFEDLVAAPFAWQPGWRYTLPAGYPRR
jgi:broad specificity phosphatase PhoE